MAFEHTYTITGNGVRATIPITAEYEIDIETTVNPEQADKEVDLDFVYTRLKSLFIQVEGLDDDETVTVEANTTGGGGGSWTVTSPGCALFLGATLNPWAANPLTADVTRLYLTNNSDENIATVRITGLYDPTP
jgi:hypothetical protein